MERLKERRYVSANAVHSYRIWLGFIWNFSWLEVANYVLIDSILLSVIIWGTTVCLYIACRLTWNKSTN